MTDRIHALTVTLSRDIRDDDCEAIVAAIMMVKGVLGVKAHVADVSLHTAQMREHRRWCEALNELQDVMGKQPVGGSGCV